MLFSQNPRAEAMRLKSGQNVLCAMLKKFSIKCLKATYFYQSPGLCCINKTTNMSNPNNYDSDRPNYIKKLLPKDPYNAPCPERLRNAPQGFFVKQVTLNYML